MPLTKFQSKIASLLAANRTEDSHLAGGAALHIQPQSMRYSNDLDYFNDTVERVASAFDADEQTLIAAGCTVNVRLRTAAFVRAEVKKGVEVTKIEWVHDSAWRFMPAIANPDCGFQLHPVDLAVNKVLALAGRHEARDFFDVMQIHHQILPLGALCWAAVGKDPGFSPLSLLELLRRQGRYHAEDFSKLRIEGGPVDLVSMKKDWLAAVDDADAFIRSRPPTEAGCLYFSRSRKQFIQSSSFDDSQGDVVCHFGKLGGGLPLQP